MEASFEIIKVESKKDLEAFIALPWTIYKDDPTWVPPLRIAVKDMLDVKKNPFYRHAYRTLWLARDRKTGRVLGRIAGILDDDHNRVHAEQTAFFGFFECVDDRAVSRALFETVLSWAAGWGQKILRGPMNPSTNHECGLLVEGFQDPPAVMMTYNRPYYAGLIEDAGFAKAKDLYAYDLSVDRPFSDKLLAFAERLRENHSITFRTVQMDRFEQEVDLLLEIYNDAWEKNWGFVPMDPTEFRAMAKEMKMVVDPELLLIAEVKKEPVGFALTLPDVNIAFAKVRDGRLFPTGLLKLLWYLKGPGRAKIDRCRIVTLGVRKSAQKYGLGPLFYTEYWNRGLRRGYNRGEAGWILEDNVQMNKALVRMNAQRTEVYRIYDRAVPSA